VLNNKKRRTILIVDDSPEDIDILTAILSPLYNIRIALNGKLALKIAGSSENIDLILLDILMQDISGYDVCNTLKTNDATNKIPVIFISSKNSITDKLDGYDAGADNYITKPIDPDYALDTIQKSFK